MFNIILDNSSAAFELALFFPYIINIFFSPKFQMFAPFLLNVKNMGGKIIWVCFTLEKITR